MLPSALRTYAPTQLRSAEAQSCSGDWALSKQSVQMVLVQLRMQLILAVLERVKEIGDIGMIDRLARIIRDQILFRNIGDVIAVIIFCQQMVEGLIFAWAAIFGNGLVPLLGIAENRIDVEHDTAKRVFAVADDLSQLIFCAYFEHGPLPPSPVINSYGREKSIMLQRIDGNRL